MKFRVVTRSYLKTKGSRECFIYNQDEIYEGEADFVPGPHLDPIDDEAIAAMEAYKAKYPNATLHPADQLPMTMGGHK